MERQGRNVVLDIFDYSGNKKCNLYDGTYSGSGQATDVYVCTERNGWRELKFLIPSVIEGANGHEPNYRLNYLKADYRIRQIDDDGIDWFLISEPKVVHQAFSKDVSVTAGHISQLLKTKNLGLEFSDEEGNNVGTALQLQTTILHGTGWNVGKVDTFYEKDETTEKVRSMKASAKTGAFKLITSMCDQFDAKPVFHGDNRTVDIVAMNPFSKPKNGSLPDVTKADGVVELNYGTNVSSLTRTLNTENIVTKLYAYGAFGDVTSGYCGIDEEKHKEYIYTITEDIAAGETYCFYPDGHSPKQFTARHDIAAGSKLIWSDLDPASRSYIWDPEHKTACYVTDASLIVYVDSEHDILTNKMSILTGTPALSAEVEIIERQNWVSYLMDYSYYQNVGLMSDEMLDQLGKYQREGIDLLETSYNASSDYIDTEFRLTEIIGDVNFCKLNIESIDSLGSYIRLKLNDVNPVLYRTDYAAQKKKRFVWTPATAIDEDGDSVNATASVLYVIHDTTPITWDKLYVKCFNDSLTDSQDGEEQESIVSLTLWADANKTFLQTSQQGDKYYLFEMNSVNGLMGEAEVSDEAKLATIQSAATVVTNKHPVYFIKSEDSLPEKIADSANGYAWAWKYSYGNPSSSQLYFYLSVSDSNASHLQYANRWVPVFFTPTPPSRSSEDLAYWYSWYDLSNYTKSALYINRNGQWAKATNKELGTDWSIDASDTIETSKIIPYDIEDIWPTFATIYNSCKARDAIFMGYNNFYTVNITDEQLQYIDPHDGTDDYVYPTSLVAGNYYFDDPYVGYRIFTTKNNVSIGGKLEYNAFKDWLVVSSPDSADETIEVKLRPIETVLRNNDLPNVIIIDKEHFHRIEPAQPSGDNHGLVTLMSQFSDLADMAYNEKLPIYLRAQDEIRKLEDDTMAILGDVYREGWWQSDDYVDGDERKLYEDAYDNVQEVSQPEATYNVKFIDTYSANKQMEYGASDLIANHPSPDLSIMSAAHLIDTEIAVNIWAYFDRINKCYDKPWQTQASINTKLSTMTQRSFTDVLTAIANVASELKGKSSIYKRAEFISSDGTLPIERLEGAIDAAKIKIVGGSSNWHTDEKGNIVFVSADNMSAMMLSGNGFALANSKDEWGNWNWRSFGSGNGFTADEIISGFISADRIQAQSISSAKLDPDTQLALGWVEGAMIRLDDDAIVSTVATALSSGSNQDARDFKASMLKQTSDEISMSFEERFTSLETDVASAKEITDAANNWFNFSSEGFEIRATESNGEPSSTYTRQTHEDYTFYVGGNEQTKISTNGMVTDKVEALSELRLGDLVATIDEGNNITWFYSKK